MIKKGYLSAEMAEAGNCKFFARAATGDGSGLKKLFKLTSFPFLQELQPAETSSDSPLCDMLGVAAVSLASEY